MMTVNILSHANIIVNMEKITEMAKGFILSFVSVSDSETCW